MKIHPIVVAVAGAAILAACGGRPGTQTTEDTAARTAEEQDRALVRIVHAIPQAPPADVFAGDEKAFSNVAFGQATAYKPVRDEEFKLTLKAAGTEQAPVIIEAQQGVDAGGRYTILAMPDRDGAAKIDVFSDEMATPPADKALVRVIHAAPEAGEVAVYSAARAQDPEIDDVDYAAPARYEAVDPADVSIRIEPRGDPEGRKSKAAAFVTKVSLEAGKAYTLVVAPPSEAGNPVAMIQIEDAVQGAANAAASDEAATGKQPAVVRGEGRGEIQPAPDTAPAR